MAEAKENAQAAAARDIAEAQKQAAQAVAKARAEGEARAAKASAETEAELAALREGAQSRQPQAVEQLIHRLLG